jgi:hypothetical protein
MMRARDCFSIDKPRVKLIRKVLISGNEADGDVKYCNRELTVNNIYLIQYHKHFCLVNATLRILEQYQIRS